MSKKAKRPRVKKIRLTDRSLNDLSAIQNFSIEQWGNRVANKYIQAIEDSLLLIQCNPDLLQHVEGFPDSLLFYRVKKHVLVFYRQDNIVVLVTVIHSSMDIPSRLAELEPMLLLEIEILLQKLK